MADMAITLTRVPALTVFPISLAQEVLDGTALVGSTYPVATTGPALVVNQLR
jgi:hypothetical protein